MQLGWEETDGLVSELVILLVDLTVLGSLGWRWPQKQLSEPYNKKVMFCVTQDIMGSAEAGHSGNDGCHLSLR